MVANKKARGRVPQASSVQSTPAFRARRPQTTEIEMVLIEKHALLYLVSLAKSIHNLRQENKIENPERDHALEVSISLGESALDIHAKTVMFPQAVKE